ncbi:MAG: FprA family A-type flavoprotein [Kiritimatiellia bacterium]|jgi:flavorubredoxin|nr:FprA family A-type flavoprotein [Kiritimatiellia bacterium]
MKLRKITDGVSWLGVVDWNRRLFDSLIPLPDGTSYNAYLVRGTDKVALVDTVDPEQWDILKDQLEAVDAIDYIVTQHAEQDHSGCLPQVLAKYPAAKVVTNAKAKDLLIDHLDLPEDCFITVQDGETLDLGGKTLEFIFTPWVHWPETMCTYLKEDRILFSCDFFGSHLATTDLYVTDPPTVYEAAKRYYAEIMMPFKTMIRSNIAKLETRDIQIIAPSHGPMYGDPAFILDAYRDWVSDKLKNEVVLPYISMHGSTQRMVDHLVGALAERGVKVHLFDLTVTDIGKLAMALVDAATIVVGTPTVQVGPHPAVVYAAHLANALRPKVKYAAVIGSYGWATKAVEQIAGAIPNLKVEILGTVMCKGIPRADDFAALDALADQIKEKHAGL